MEFLEFRKKIDKNDNETYIFYPIGNIKPFYKTVIVLDPLNDDLEGNMMIVQQSCDCKDFDIRKRTCKHIKECIEILKKRKVPFRTDGPFERYFCTLCKRGIDSYDYVENCGYCKTKLVLPKKKDELQK